MSFSLSNGLRTIFAIAITATFAFSAATADAQSGSRFSADTKAQQGRDGGQYVPTVWIDPDGCEHWVMDDGAEGYMTPHVSRQGIPVCRRADLCGVMNTDQFFATNSAKITRAGQQRLAEFFSSANAVAYVISGHTDSRASDEYNMRLSIKRANSVARVAQSAGAKISDVRGFGERMPKAANTTAAGMAQNRRVEIICFR